MAVFEILDPPGDAHIAVGFFDAREGPQLLAISSNIIAPQVLIDYLFPSRWEDETSLPSK
jgi:hypothetical protein